MELSTPTRQARAPHSPDAPARQEAAATTPSPAEPATSSQASRPTSGTYAVDSDPYAIGSYPLVRRGIRPRSAFGAWWRHRLQPTQNAVQRHWDRWLRDDGHSPSLRIVASDPSTLRWGALAALAALSRALLTAAYAYLAAPAVKLVDGVMRDPSSSALDELGAVPTRWVATALAIVPMLAALRYVEAKASALANSRGRRALMRAVVDRVMQSTYGVRVSNKELAYRSVHDVALWTSSLRLGWLPALRQVTLAFALAWLLWRFSWPSALAFFATAAATIGWAARHMREQRFREARLWRTEAATAARIGEAYELIDEASVRESQSDIVTWVDGYLSVLLRREIDACMHRARLMPTVEALLGAVLAGLVGIWWLWPWASPGGLASSLLFVAVALLMLRPFGGLAGSLQSMARGLAARAHLDQLLTLAVHQRGPSAADEVLAAPQAWRVRQLEVGYAPGQPLLPAIDLALRPGDWTCILGPPGIGKSTLLRTLAGALSPLAGSQEVLRAEVWSPPRGGDMAWLPQSPAFAGDSVAFNVLLRAPILPQDEQLLATALHRVGALPWLKQLRHGVMSPLEEGGRNLSGGQARRLGLARCLSMRAPILLLDEPTTGLDESGIDHLARELRLLCEAESGSPPMILCATHHLGFARRADRILDLRSLASSPMIELASA